MTNPQRGAAESALGFALVIPRLVRGTHRSACTALAWVPRTSRGMTIKRVSLAREPRMETAEIAEKDTEVAEALSALFAQPLRPLRFNRTAPVVTPVDTYPPPSHRQVREMASREGVRAPEGIGL